MEIDKDFNVITDNSKVNINLLKQIETLKAENELYKKSHIEFENRYNKTEKEITKLKEQLKEVESQLNDRGGFDILRAAINEVLKN